MGFSLQHLTICLFMKSETSKLQVYYMSALKTYFAIYIYIIYIYIYIYVCVYICICVCVSVCVCVCVCERIQNEVQRNTSPKKYANIQTITIM